MAEEVLMTLGEYQFGMSTAAFEEMSRSTQYRWASQARLTREPAMQYMGPGSTTIKLKGSIYPHFRGGLGQMPNMRAEAETGEPLTLVDGRGNNLGRFCIKEISDTEGVFIGPGIPRRIDFSLSLELYGEDGLPPSGGSNGGDGGGDNGGGIFNWLSLFS